MLRAPCLSLRTPNKQLELQDHVGSQHWGFYFSLRLLPPVILLRIASVIGYLAHRRLALGTLLGELSLPPGGRLP